MNFSEVYKITLVALLIACAVSVNLTRSLLRSVIIFMSYSSIMCLLWILMESPDLAITEAAVGAGISGYLFLVTLKKLRQIDSMEDAEAHAGGTMEDGAWTDTAPEPSMAMPTPVQASPEPDGPPPRQTGGTRKQGKKKSRHTKGGAGKRKEGGV